MIDNLLHLSLFKAIVSEIYHKSYDTIRIRKINGAEWFIYYYCHTRDEKRTGKGKDCNLGNLKNYKRVFNS